MLAPTRWPRPLIRICWSARNRQWGWDAAGFVVLLAGGAMALWGMFPVDLHGPWRYPGIMAPACGATRSVVALLHGDAVMAWRYNPLGFLMVLAAAAGVVRLVLGVLTRRWLTLFVRPGPLGWSALVLLVVALDVRQQGHAALLMSTGLR
ncbi:hypothetical protein GCM10010289_44430 [Streptomyces violascens]|uniref:DUF2752 domain-containing protein n=2 Tax=Streptomyces violascens TaxID=67381 RepID=A0ABQ3QXP0_9ACTN|nr:hypothetical protein GCM10010289_44430 [Streptomyces violascens]GHI42035.1 hypothetical protein Sviol_64430 [Streptomyces violascens]